MAVKRTRRSELAEFVPDHFFGDDDRNVLLAVIDAERQADELRQYGRAARPNADHVVAPRRARGIGFLEQIAIDKRTLPDRARHDCSSRSLFALLAGVTARHNELGVPLVLAGLCASGRLAPRRHRMTATPRAAAERVIDRVHGLAAD